MMDYMPRVAESYSRSSSASSNYTTSSRAPSLPSKSFTPALDTRSSKASHADSIRCSDCGVWVELMLMGEHTCETGAPTPFVGVGEKRRKPDMKVDTTGLQPRELALGASLSANSPMRQDFSPQPLTPSREPDWPAFPISPPLARSVSGDSNISTSSSTRLPFLQRYQQLVGTIAAGSNLTLSRTTSAAANLVAFSFTPPTTPGTPPVLSSNQESPLDPTSVSTTSHARKIGSSGPSLRAVSPQPSRDSSQRSNNRRPEGSQRSTASSQSSGRALDAVGAFMTSSSPALSRKITLGERVPRDSDLFSLEDYEHHDRRATLKGSHSTPALLSSYSTSPTSYSSRPRQGGMERSGSRSSRERQGSAKGLDACLEDLRIMGLEEEDGGSSILDDFFSEEEEGDDNDALALTPRPFKRGTMPSSRSTPSIPSASMNASASMSSALNSRLSRDGRKDDSRQCTTCRRSHKEWQIQRAGDGQVFCRPCYADRFLPKCRKCTKAIEGGAVTSSDGKVTGKYHPDCFSCFLCSAPFPNKEFYVFDQKPYCQQHYHELNGSLCTDTHCGKPIEGPCVSLVGEENGGGGRYHPACFKCSHYSCGIPLLDHHFVASKLPYCERHANAHGRRSSRAGDDSTSSNRTKSSSGYKERPPGSKAKKRMTIITRR